MESAITVLLISILILFNGFFVAAEYALVTLRRTRVEEMIKKRRKNASLIKAVQEDLHKYISATQLGVTLTSLAVGWVGEPFAAGLFEPLFAFLPKTYALVAAHSLAAICGFFTITFLHVVFGELVPKALSLQRTDATALTTVRPLLWFAKLFNPFIWLLDNTSSILLQWLGLSMDAPGQTAHTQEEVKTILSQSGQTGLIPQDEVAMANNAFKLGNTEINQIMLPRTDIVGFESRMPMEKVMQLAIDSPHSRFPVYKKSLDHIIGYVHSKDLFRLLTKKKQPKVLKDISEMREILTVPATKRANDVLLDMQRQRIHMAVVADEFGGTEGIVTLEDIIESLVGEIYDEFEKPERLMRKLADGSYSVDGSMSVEELQKLFRLPLKGHAYTTLGGLVFGLLGRVPAVGDSVQVGDVRFEITATEGKRVTKLKVKKVSNGV